MAADRPGAVLFMCSMNSVRSPMAEALMKSALGRAIYVQSAGVRKGEVDGFVREVLDELGIDAARHRPKTIEELEDWEGLTFDLVVSLSPEAHHRALELTRTNAIDVEYWPTLDPTLEQGSREQRLDAYRMVRDQLSKKIRQRFGGVGVNV